MLYKQFQNALKFYKDLKYFAEFFIQIEINKTTKIISVTEMCVMKKNKRFMKISYFFKNISLKNFESNITYLLP